MQRSTIVRGAGIIKNRVLALQKRMIAYEIGCDIVVNDYIDKLC